MPAFKQRCVAKLLAAILLDGNVLVALVDEAHVHHVQARSWFSKLTGGFATCPIIQGTLLGLMVRVIGLGANHATALLMALTRHPRHHFCPGSLPHGQVQWHGFMGHRQVTDAYLAGGAGSASRRQAREFRPGVGRVAP